MFHTRQPSAKLGPDVCRNCTTQRAGPTASSTTTNSLDKQLSKLTRQTASTFAPRASGKQGCQEAPSVCSCLTPDLAAASPPEPHHCCCFVGWSAALPHPSGKTKKNPAVKGTWLYNVSGGVCRGAASGVAPNGQVSGNDSPALRTHTHTHTPPSLHCMRVLPSSSTCPHHSVHHRRHRRHHTRCLRCRRGWRWLSAACCPSTSCSPPMSRASLA